MLSFYTFQKFSDLIYLRNSFRLCVLREYNFSAHGIIHEPNFDELKKRFPIFDGLSAKEIGEKALYMYLNTEVTIEEIEECLDTPSTMFL